MGPLNNTNDPAVSAMLPSLIALRNAGVIDGTLGCGATPAERAEAYRLQALFERWEQRHPWIQTFLDPPFAIVILSDAEAIPSLGNILASIPHRFVDAPVDPSDGTPTAGLVQGVGGVESARWIGDFLHTHYQDSARTSTGPAPQGVPSGYRVISFTASGVGILIYH
jgi:hypothetical protein